MTKEPRSRGLSSLLGFWLSLLPAVWLATAAILLFTAGFFHGITLSWTITVYLLVTVVASILAVVAYASDKQRARNDQWRIPERSLHLLALVGGWPGAMLAQRWFRHKTQKFGFRATTWGIAGLHCLLIFVGWMFGLL